MYEITRLQILQLGMQRWPRSVGTEESVMLPWWPTLASTGFKSITQSLSNEPHIPYHSISFLLLSFVFSTFMRTEITKIWWQCHWVGHFRIQCTEVSTLWCVCNWQVSQAVWSVGEASQDFLCSA